MSTPLLDVNLTAGYGKSAVLREVAFTLERGECLGLVGASGAGKSTLVLALLGLLPWKQGSARGHVLFNGSNLLALKERELRALRGRQIALVPQSPLTALNPALSLRSHFREAWRAHERSREGCDARVRELLAQVQLPNDDDFLTRKPEQISVGQAQRVVLALALLHRPALLIADEPTSALDPATQSEVVALLRRIQREQQLGMLYISHDLVSVLQLSDRVGVLAHGLLQTPCAPCSLAEETASPELLQLLQALPVPLSILMQYMADTVVSEDGSREGTITDSSRAVAASSVESLH